MTMANAAELHAAASTTANAEFARLEDARRTSEAELACNKDGYLARRIDLLVISALQTSSDQLPCLKCSADHFEKARLESVASLPIDEQNALGAQMWLLIGVFLAVVAGATQSLITLDVPQGHEETTVGVSLAAVCVTVLWIIGGEQSMTSYRSWLLFSLLGVAQAGVIAAIDSANDSRSLRIICCTMSLTFLFVAAWLTWTSHHQGVATGSEQDIATPTSPAKPSYIAYLLAAIAQIITYAATDDSAFVTCDGLVACLITELVLVVYLLWDLSNMWSVMRKEEAPRILGSLYVNLLVVALFLVMLVAILASVILFVIGSMLCMCVRCSNGDKDSGGDDGAAEQGAARGGKTAAAWEAMPMKPQALGDAFYKKLRGV